jgi:uncharacterized protein YjbI with pentapeptide repeats
VWECPHDALDEREYCAFHTDPENLPAEIDEGELFVEAINEVSVDEDDSVARQKKQFVGATFGPLNIEGARLDAGDEYPIRLTHAEFTAGILADETVIRHSLHAERTHLETNNDSCVKVEGISFKNAQFSGNAYLSFNNAQFSGDSYLSFNNAEFSGDAYLSFERATFRDKADLSLRRAVFCDEADLSFSDAQFSSDVSLGFDDAQFGDKADIRFSDAQFSGTGGLSFEEAGFDDKANVSFRRAVSCDEAEIRFDDVTFSDDSCLRFDYAQFSDRANVLFRDASFCDEGSETNLSFDRSQFSDETGLSFYDAIFSGDSGLSFSGAEFSGDGGLSFRRTEFCDEDDKANLRFYRAEFSGGGGLWFDHAQFGDETDLLLNDAQFSDETDLSFDDAQFSGEADLSFKDAGFDDKANVSFRRAVFYDRGNKTDLSFNRAKFGDKADVSFSDARFSGDGYLSFSRAQFSDGADVEFNGAEFGDKIDLSFDSAQFNGDGYLSLSDTVFNGDGYLSFEETVISRVCYFIDSYFEPDREIVFSGAEVEERLTFKQSREENSRYVRGQFDFSDATFHDELRFLRSRQSATDQSDDNDEQSRFDLVFVDAINFSGTNFRNPPDFSTTRFPADTDFTNATFQNADFQNADVTGTDEVSSASFDAADLSNVNFSGANLTGASFERALLSRAELLGADLTRTKLYSAVLGDARINRETKFWIRSSGPAWVLNDSPRPIRALHTIKRKLRKYSYRGQTDPYCVYDPRYCDDEESDLEKAVETYGTLESLAYQNSLPGLAGECFLGRKDTQFRRYWRDHNWLMIIRSALPTVIARYGESPVRVIGSGGLTILVIGFVYFAFDLIEHTETGEPATLFESLYFSALTFTTLGYGDFNPVTRAGRLLAVVETSIGVILLAILVFVFGRRATR